MSAPQETGRTGGCAAPSRQSGAIRGRYPTWANWRESGLSRAHFFRLFTEATGMAPGLFANMLRMEVAVGEMITGRRSMTEVSDELGFSAPAHFTRFFRSHAGSAPSEFRSIARLQQAA
jgi:AraC-like DNA-binding protein